jgi:uncharacterized protein Yka (UPF0111/DUF47 family)
VINKIQSHGVLELASDNRFYEPYTLAADEVFEVWAIHLKITSFNASPSHFQNGFQENMKDMSQTIESQAEAIKGLNRTLEQLLKQHRASNMVR